MAGVSLLAVGLGRAGGPGNVTGPSFPVWAYFDCSGDRGGLARE